MANTYILVAENEKIEFSPESNSEIIGFAFTPISRCIGFFTIDKKGNFIVVHIDPFTDLKSVLNIFEGREIVTAKMIFNPFAKHAKDRRTEVDEALATRFAMLQKISLNEQKTSTSNDSIAILMNLNGEIIDQGVTIKSNSIECIGNKYKIFPSYAGFAEVNKVLEDIRSILCHREGDKKPVRSVGEICFIQDCDVCDFLVNNKLDKKIEEYSRISIRGLRTDIDKDLARSKQLLGIVLKQLKNEEGFSSWDNLLKEFRYQKEKADIERDDDFLRDIERKEDREDILEMLREESKLDSLEQIKNYCGELFDGFGEVGCHDGVERFGNLIKYIEILQKRVEKVTPSEQLHLGSAASVISASNKDKGIGGK
jgi:hypothetical protein